MPNIPISKAGTAIVTILLFVFLCIAGVQTWEFTDSYFWDAWSVHIYRFGLSDAYHSGTNYMPMLQYVLYVFGRWVGDADEIWHHLTYLKIFAIAFDFIGLWYVYKFLGNRISFIALLIINVLNLAFIYDSVIWGQFDAVLSALNYIAVYYAFKGQMNMSAAFYMMAFNMKVQAVILLPVLGFFYIINIVEQKNWKAIIYPLIVMVVVQFVFLLPFIHSVDELKRIWAVLVTSVDNYPMVSMYAYNIWYLIYPGAELHNMPDSELLIWGLSCKTVGLALFFMSSFVALYPLLKILLQKVSGKKVQMIAKHKLWIICALLYLLFFYFNTQMHERYSHPAFLFIISYAFYNKKYLVYVLFSIVFFLSLESLMHWLALNNYHTAIFDARVLAIIYGVIIFYLFYLLYKKDNTKEL